MPPGPNRAPGLPVTACMDRTCKSVKRTCMWNLPVQANNIPRPERCETLTPQASVERRYDRATLQGQKECIRNNYQSSVRLTSPNNPNYKKIPNPTTSLQHPASRKRRVTEANKQASPTQLNSPYQTALPE